MNIGEVIRGKYRLLRLLGDGGMGAVYEASHEQLGTRVAIKVLHPELARKTGLVERFMQEARVAAQIRSPNVVQVTDIDKTSDGTAYIVMELLEGEPLGATLDRQGKLPLPQACDFTRQILLALEAAHALGVVHRDLKPENVFVTYQATRPVLKLIDFGIAKLRNATSGLDPGVVGTRKNLTVAGVLMGTAEYMAPEQAHGADRADARSDVYAVGVMLYEMIAGKRPVAGEDARAIAAKVERGEIVPLVHVAPDVPREIAGLVHRAMAVAPAIRFQSATEMRLALDAALAGKAVTAATPQQSAVPPTQRTAPVAARGPHNTVNLQAPVSQSPNTVPARPATQVLDASRAQQQTPDGTSRASPESVARSAGARGGQDQPEQAPRTERAGPSPIAYGLGSDGGYGHPAAAGGTAPSMPSFHETGGERKGRRGLWAMIIVPLLLGAGVVTALVLESNDTPAPSARPLPTIPPPIDLTATAAPTSTSVATATAAPGAIASLTPTPRSGAPGSAGSSRPTDPGHGAHPPPGDTAFVPTMPTGFPSAFPIPFPTMGDGGAAGLPFPFPSAFPTTFPSTLPFPIPFPTATASAEPAPPTKSL